MTDKNISSHFARRVLPWLVAIGAAILYVCTVNHWITIGSLPMLARLEQWDWRPQATKPLYFLLTWPLRLLSGTTHFVALNLFSAVCAALSLGLMARCVSLLPHDRTRDQRHREGTELSFLSVRFNWVPPLVAVLILAFQSSFWEHATTATGEMFDLLIFAYACRCLLEFRTSGEESWATKLAFVYGLGITNNWAMIGFFPIFLISLIRIKGMGFFNNKFFLRLLLFGVAGLSFYLVLPVISIFSGADFGFWETLKSNLGHQKTFLFSLPFVRFPELRAHLFVMSLSSLLPLLFISIRWPAFEGDVNAAAAFLTSVMFRVLHLVFLTVCIWAMFDPKFGPRALSYGLMPFLTFYFIGALCIGYLLGYILLLFGKSPEVSLTREKRPLVIMQRAFAVIVGVIALAVPFALAAKNFPSIQASNSPVLLRFAKYIAETLPKKESVLLSDDPVRIYLLKALESRGEKTVKHLILDTASLQSSNYHAFLWKNEPIYHSAVPRPPTQPNDAMMIGLLEILGQQHQLIYLHPSFGYYFERFYPVPHGLTEELKVLPEGSFLPPPLPDDVIAENENFWTTAKNEIANLPRLALKNDDARLVASYYSRSLNNWGVELQRLNKLDPAKARFEDALWVNPDNVNAEVNLKCNEQLHHGVVKSVEASAEVKRKLGQYRSAQAALTVNGAFDDPDLLPQLGELFGMGGNFRQSVQFFTRALQLQPDQIVARLGLAKSLLELAQSEKALEQIAIVRREIKKEPKDSKLDMEKLQFELLRIEALAYTIKEEFNVALELLNHAAKEQPKNERISALLNEVYFQAAVQQMRKKNYNEAVDAFTAVIRRDANNVAAYLNRAIAYLTLNKLQEAQRDYEKVQQLSSKRVYQAFYGLAEIAARQKNQSEAVKNYKFYLDYAPTNTVEYKEVTDKLRALQGSNKK